MAFFGRKEATSEVSPTDLIKQETAQKLATADVTELVNNMTKSCFNLCFEQPGSQVSNVERNCTQNCVKKFMEAWNTTSEVYVNRLKQA